MKFQNNDTGKIWDQSDNGFKSYGQKNSKYAVQEFGQHLAPNLNRTFGSAQWKIVRVAELFL